MKIVILDRKTLGVDINLNRIEKNHEVISFDTTQKEQTSERIKDAEIVITNKALVCAGDMELADKLKLICVAATGYNNIDIPAARKLGIVVANVKGYSSDSVAQLVFGYLLEYFNSIRKVANEIEQGLWQKSDTFIMLNNRFSNLAGKKIGIIGYGKIGKTVERIAKGFGMEVLICESFIEKNNKPDRIGFQDLLKNSDIISLHCPLTETTKNLISAKEFSLMKPTAVLINTARGGIVNENDLYNALKNNQIAFAGVDVLTTEPPTNGNILFDAPNCMITPHIAWASEESRIKLVEGIENNISKFIEGRGNEIDLCV